MTSPIMSPVYDARRVTQLLGIELASVEGKLTPFDLLPPVRREGYVTFFDPGRSILQLREAVKSKECKIFFMQDWYDDEDFATLEEQPRYRQICMEAVKDSFGTTFEEQQKLLGKDEEIPLARVVVMGMVIHFLATGERLFPSYYVRCADKSSDGDRVVVGYFGVTGLFVDDSWGGGPSSRIGVAAARKS